MRRIWIGLSGKKGSGKTTVAMTLVGNWGFVRLSFADKLKRICSEMFPDIAVGDKEEFRRVLQRVGTNFRQIQPYCWINYLLRKISPSMKRVVIDDVRYRNEYSALKSLGFKLVRLERNDRLRREWGYDIYDDHPSETELDDPIIKWDLRIINDYPYPFWEATLQIVEAFKIGQENLWRQS